MIERASACRKVRNIFRNTVRDAASMVWKSFSINIPSLRDFPNVWGYTFSTHILSLTGYRERGVGYVRILLPTFDFVEGFAVLLYEKAKRGQLFLLNYF